MAVLTRSRLLSVSLDWSVVAEKSLLGDGGIELCVNGNAGIMDVFDAAMVGFVSFSFFAAMREGTLQRTFWKRKF